MPRTKQRAPNRQLGRAHAAGAASPESSATSPMVGQSSGTAATTPRRTQRKRYRYKPGTAALREIRNLQKSVKLLIPTAPFIRLVKEISNVLSSEVTRWTAEALTALQEEAEDYLIQMFQDSMLCVVHARRVTLMKKDFQLARRLGGRGRPY